MGTFFTDRLGGHSLAPYHSLNLGDHVGDSPDAVSANRKSITDRFGPTQFMRQVHGSRVAVIEEVTEEYPSADALVTGIAGITLAVMVADCIPLLLVSKHSVAAVHVGRRGLLNRVTEQALMVMREIGADDISANIGPAICGNCYEVSEDIFKEVTVSHPMSATTTLADKPALDLIAGLIYDLNVMGVTRITNQGRCTREEADLFSYRRDGVTGRSAGLVWL